MRVILIIAGLLVSLFSFSSMASNAPDIFKTDSYNKLITQTQEPFIMVLWSLDCPPCIKELDMLGALYKQNPRLNLVLVSTDSMSRLDEINTLIEKSGLHGLDNRVFSDESVQRLRYSIDPGWYGELPRSYFHGKNNSQRSAVSGLLDTDKIVAWLGIN